MRLSLPSRFLMPRLTALLNKNVEFTSCQQPSVSRHCDSGAVPFICRAGAGTPYSPTPTVDALSDRLGDAVLSELVFASFHTTMEFDVPSSAKTARELVKYSVPPFDVSYCVPAVAAGMTLKPVPKSGPTPFVLVTVTGKVKPPDARTDFDIA